jgi:hypothetical protein
MGSALSILTSGFLVTVVIFLVLMGILFWSSYRKVGEILLDNDPQNDVTDLSGALNNLKVAYISAFIAAFLALVLAVLYAGHETVINPSEYIHLGIFAIVYIAMIISVIYAAVALNKIYRPRIINRNGSAAYIWAGLLLAIFAFVGLTMSSSGRIGYNLIRSRTRNRIESAEYRIHTELPAIHQTVSATNGVVSDTHNVVATHLPEIRGKVNDLHVANGLSAPMEQQYVMQPVAQQQYIVSQAPVMPPAPPMQMQASPQYVPQMAQPSGLLLPQTFPGQPCNQPMQTVRRI